MWWNSNNSFQHYSFGWTQLNVFTYCHVWLTIHWLLIWHIYSLNIYYHFVIMTLLLVDFITCGRPERTYIQQRCEDTECCPEDLPEAMYDREKLRERVRDIRATSTTWWWWWWLSPVEFLFWIYCFEYSVKVCINPTPSLCVVFDTGSFLSGYFFFVNLKTILFLLCQSHEIVLLFV